MRFTPWLPAAVLTVVVACASTSTTTSTSTTMTATPATSADSIGRFVWHDLMTDNVSAVRRFYHDLLGWEFTDVMHLDRPYTLVRDRDQVIGGIVGVEAAQQQQVSQWIAYQAVENLDESVAVVQTLGGGMLVGPETIDSIGRAAVLRDPQGAPFGVIQVARPVPAESTTPMEGAFVWMEYLARDPTTAGEFYAETFGYRLDVTYDYAILSRDRARAGVLRAPTPDTRPAWLPYVLVLDPANVAARVTSLGGRVLLAPHAGARRGSLAVIADPSGAMLALQKYPY